MAINELDRRRKRLEEYQIKARFALAESYDRATKSQLDEEIAKQMQAQEPQAKEDTKPEEKQTETDKEEPAEQEEAVQEQLQDAPSSEDDTGASPSFKQQILSR